MTKNKNKLNKKTSLDVQTKSQPSTTVVADNDDDNEYSPTTSTRPTLPVHSRQAAFSFLYLFFFSVLMFTLPFGAFFVVQRMLRERDIVGFANTCWSVFSSVVIVNLIIIGYCYKAYHEQEYDDEGNEIDQKKND